MGKLADTAKNYKFKLEVKEGTDIDEVINEIEVETGISLRNKLSRGGYVVLKNGHNYSRLTGEEKVVENNDSISIVPIVGGG